AIGQKGETERMRQSAYDDIDANVVLLRRIEGVRSVVQHDRRNADIGRLRDGRRAREDCGECAQRHADPDSRLPMLHVSAAAEEWSIHLRRCREAVKRSSRRARQSYRFVETRNLSIMVYMAELSVLDLAFVPEGATP